MSNTTNYIIENKDQPEHRLELDIQDDPEKKLLLASPKGRIDIFTYRDMYKRMDEVLEGRDRLLLVFDFSKVSFVASSGWFVFVTLRARLKRSGGILAFTGLNQDMSRVYKSMKMDELIASFDSVDAALENFNKP
jgi:anti-sigma B factor antagonist